MEFFGMQTTTKIVVADIYDPMYPKFQLEQVSEFPIDVWGSGCGIATVVLEPQHCARTSSSVLLIASDFFLGQPAFSAGSPTWRIT
jgi:hypothetical protein